MFRCINTQLTDTLSRPLHHNCIGRTSLILVQYYILSFNSNRIPGSVQLHRMAGTAHQIYRIFPGSCINEAAVPGAFCHGNDIISIPGINPVSLPSGLNHYRIISRPCINSMSTAG